MIKKLPADFLHKELSEGIIKAFYKVYNALRFGFLEKVYENALMLELRKEGLPSENQKPITVFYEEEKVGEYFAEILVDNKIIIEIKTAKQISKKHEAQLLHYLKATDIEVGLVLNFGVRAEFKRLAFDNKRK